MSVSADLFATFSLDMYDEHSYQNTCIRSAFLDVWRSSPCFICSILQRLVSHRVLVCPPSIPTESHCPLQLLCPCPLLLPRRFKISYIFQFENTSTLIQLNGSEPLPKKRVLHQVKTKNIQRRRPCHLFPKLKISLNLPFTKNSAQCHY